MDVLLDPRFKWRTQTRGGVTLHWRGDAGAAAEAAGALAALPAREIEPVATALAGTAGHFALIAECPDAVVAAVDHCRSVPVFAATDGARPCVSNDARAARDHAGLVVPDEDSVLEAAMAGYVTGPHTLYRGLSQLEAGEVLVWRRDRTAVARRRYFTYWPDRFEDGDEATLARDLGAIIDRAIARVIAGADGAPVWVPLSAGLDSRLILAKLVEQGCPNLAAFTYGQRGNDEARAAAHVAKRLGVDWRFCPDSARTMRQLFASAAFRDYWAFGDGLCSVPNTQDYPALARLKAAGEIPDGTVIVNGQTGDFISGGHIPASLWALDAPTLDDLFAAIADKHYALWASLQTADNLARLRRRVWADLELAGDEAPARHEIIALYERWEYQERQAKHIVNGQRNYDALGLDWALPLWDRELVEFWRTVPLELKFAQRLYRQYLDDWNFRDLFRDYHPVVWQWPGLMKAVLPIFRLIRLARGPAARDRFLKLMLYFGMYRHFYAPFGFATFRRHAQDLRNPISLYSRAWLAELGLGAGER